MPLNQIAQTHSDTSALCRYSCCPWSAVLHFDVYLKYDTLGVIKLSSAAYNSSRSYQVFILVQCVICLHFRRRLKIETHTHRTELLAPPALPFGFSFLLVVLLSSPTFSPPSPPLLLLFLLPPVWVSVCQVEREEKGVISSPLRRSPVSLQRHFALRICVCVNECSCVLCVVCVCMYTVCMYDRALTQPVKHWEYPVTLNRLHIKTLTCGLLHHLASSDMYNT